MSTTPLAGVRVLAVEQQQALPFATQLFARLGAEVIKVEHPEIGESGRTSIPAMQARDGRTVGATYLRNNLGKRSVGIDLKRPEGRDLFLRLAQEVDIVGENFKSGTMDRLGLGYADVAKVAPRVVYVSVSGFGNLLPSPYQEWPAYAAMAESMAGFYERNRRNGERPRSGTACALGDIGTALFASIGILAALHERDRTGEGQYVDVSMFDAMIAMADIVPFFWSMGLRQERGYAAPPVGIMDSFAVQDGYVVIQVMREWHLESLAELVGRPDWVDDPRLAERRAWAERYEELLLPSLEEWGKQHTMIEATNALAAVGVAAAPSFGPEDLAVDEHVREHGMLVEVPREDGGDPMLVPGNPIKLAGGDEYVPTTMPLLGEDTDAVLTELAGVTPEELASLRDAGVVG
jgi:crotonobetainyl-CoA:carnitine CoA-transferase CaiB-like acyl-CoA transferase